MRRKLTKALLAGLAATATAGGLAAIPASASAQGYPYQGTGQGYGGGYYDQCRNDLNTRGTIGGVTGAAIGATVGSGIAARGVRTEGAVLGGLLGAAIGAGVGQQSSGCTNRGYGPPPPPPQVAYESHSPGRDYGYGSAYGEPVPYGGNDGAYTQPYSVAGADECSTARSDVHMPDGRIENRYVRVCRDASGRYQVVE